MLLVVAAIIFKFYREFYCKFYCTCDQSIKERRLLLRRMNRAVERLGERVPGSFIRNRTGSVYGHVSKLDTLRGAVRYIGHLQTAVNRHDQQQDQQQQQQPEKHQ